MIEPDKIKGKNARVLTKALGSKCLKIIDDSLTPAARAALIYSNLRVFRNSALTGCTSAIQLKANKINNNDKKFGVIIADKIIKINKTGIFDQISINL